MLNERDRKKEREEERDKTRCIDYKDIKNIQDWTGRKHTPGVKGVHGLHQPMCKKHSNVFSYSAHLHSCSCFNVTCVSVCARKQCF